jgi:polyphosphate glucokinase
MRLGVDVGGSSIKAALVDATQGRLASALEAAPTPQPATPLAVIEAVATLDARLGARGAVGFAVPSVVVAGHARTAANIDPSWLGFAGGAALGARLGRPVAFLNDADAAGIAEMRWGAGRGERGTVLVLTLGTGIGSAPFVDGRLWPNSELGHLELLGVELEQYASARTRTTETLDWATWCKRLNAGLAHLHRLLWPDLFILCGAVTDHYAQFAAHVRAPVPVRPAALGPAAGVIGAALAAADLEAGTR